MFPSAPLEKGDSERQTSKKKCTRFIFKVWSNIFRPPFLCDLWKFKSWNVFCLSGFFIFLFFAFVFVVVVFVLQEDEVRPLGFTDPPKLPLIGLHWYSPPHHFHATAKATNQRQSRAGLIGENIGIYNYCVCASVSFGPNDTDNCFSSSRSEQKEAQI